MSLPIALPWRSGQIVLHQISAILSRIVIGHWVEISLSPALLDLVRVIRIAVGFPRIQGTSMLNTATLDELARKIGRAIEASPAKDIEKNIKAMLQSGLQRLDLVPREEFELQAQVLLRTREKLEALETRVAELETRKARPRAK